MNIKNLPDKGITEKYIGGYMGEGKHRQNQVLYFFNGTIYRCVLKLAFPKLQIETLPRWEFYLLQLKYCNIAPASKNVYTILLPFPTATKLLASQNCSVLEEVAHLVSGR